MAALDIIVIGASWGGVEALSTLAAGLPADLPAAVLVVLHISPDYPSVLPKILERAGPLRASHARHGEKLRRSHIYVAPPDRHLLVEGEILKVLRGPRENGHRPAVDALFRTAAYAGGPRVIGVVLTGMQDCGASGLRTIKDHGGLAVVQDPADASAPSMPLAALEAVQADHVLPLREIPRLLARLAGRPASDKPPRRSGEDREAELLLLDPTAMVGRTTPGTPSGFSCPDCHGVLWELSDGELLRFRCRTGHGYSAQALESAQVAELDDALYAALRALEEKSALARTMAARSRKSGRSRSAEIFERKAATTEKQVLLLRQMLLSEDVPESGSGQG